MPKVFVRGKRLRYLKKRNPFKKSITTRLARRIVSKGSDTHYFQRALNADFSDITTTISSSGLLNFVAQGDDVNNRQGREISLKSILVDGMLEAANATVCDNINVHLMLAEVEPGFSSGNIQTAMGSTSAVPLTPIPGQGIVKVLWRKRIAVQRPCTELDMDVLTPQLNPSGSTPSARYIKIYKQFKKPIRIRYDTTTAAAPTNRLIYLFAVSDITTPGPNMTVGFWRITFSD